MCLAMRLATPMLPALAVAHDADCGDRDVVQVGANVPRGLDEPMLELVQDPQCATEKKNERERQGVWGISYGKPSMRGLPRIGCVL